MISEEYVESFDGVKLYLRRDTVTKPLEARAVFVLCHGVTCEHRITWDYATMRLNAQGYTVYRYDHRGHGRSEGERGGLKHWTDIVEDLDVIVRLAKEENPGKKIFLMGHSLGGGVVTSYGMLHPGSADGLIPVDGFCFDSAHVFGALPEDDAPEEPVKSVDQAEDKDEYYDANCYAVDYNTDYATNDLIIRSIGMGLVLSTHEEIRLVRQQAKNIVDPIMIINGQIDPLVLEADARRLYSEVSSKDKTLHILGRMKHEVFNDIQKDEVIDLVLLWARRQLAGTVTGF